MENTQDRISIAVCVITYGRPLGLIRLLDSLEKQLFVKCAEPDWKIIVVDNDSSAPNRDYIEKLALSFPTGINYDVEPTRGIASARNTSVKLAGDVDYIAFVDDDEVAEENWLDELLFGMQTYKTDVVKGPVIPDFEVRPREWIIRGGFFERERFLTGTEIEYPATNNVLVAQKWFHLFEGPFDERLNFTGGSDSLFFAKIRQEGAKFIWIDEAVVYEYSPPQRATQAYLLRRAKRSGLTTVLVEILAKNSIFSKFIRLVKCLGHFVVGIVLFVPNAIIKGRVGLVKSLMMINRAHGEFLGLTGKSYEIYK